MTQSIRPVKGFRFSAVSAGIKKVDSTRLDFALIVSDSPAEAAAVTTTNLVFAAPVEITRRRAARGRLSAVVINSGNANAFTGAKGLEDALDLTAAVAQSLKVDPELVAPMSTGVIGQPLPMERILPKVQELASGLDRGAFMDVATAILTTDTLPKTVLQKAEIGGIPVTMAGMAKGAGMIAPNMATLLCVILTDVKVESSFLREALAEAMRDSFNAITVDGDMSTNDTVIVLAGGHESAVELGSAHSDREAFRSLLNGACANLARKIVQDGEGVTKVVEVCVCGASDNEAAMQVARTIADSPLVKTAFHGEDPNWGRIICAAGRAGIPFAPDRVDLFIGNVPIVQEGTIVESDWEPAAHRRMKAGEFQVRLDLKSGDGEARILTTDLSEEYVSINADYRS